MQYVTLFYFDRSIGNKDWAYSAAVLNLCDEYKELLMRKGIIISCRSISCKEASSQQEIVAYGIRCLPTLVVGTTLYVGVVNIRHLFEALRGSGTKSAYKRFKKVPE